MISRKKTNHPPCPRCGVPGRTLNASAPDPAEFFEAPQVEIDKFDRKFSKTALRQYKYPKVELERHQHNVAEYNKKHVKLPFSP